MLLENLNNILKFHYSFRILTVLKMALIMMDMISQDIIFYDGLNFVSWSAALDHILRIKRTPEKTWI